MRARTRAYSKILRRRGSCCCAPPFLQIEPSSYFGHPVERFPILPPSRAPACHSVRGCSRFRRPKGNNPSLRSPDHVEDRVSFLWYYGFLYFDVCTRVCIYRVHGIYISSICMRCIYICTYTCIDRKYVCVRLALPYDAKEAS